MTTGTALPALSAQGQDLLMARPPAGTDPLSNEHPSELEYLGRRYLCATSAYQAQQCADPRDRALFEPLDDPSARVLARSLPRRTGWDRLRMAHMRGILMAKFTQSPELLSHLLATGNREIQAGTADPYWGIRGGVGLNWLGRFLMDLRTMLASDPEPPSPLPPMRRHLLLDLFEDLTHVAAVRTEHLCATERYLVRRIREARLWNPDFDQPREERELRLILHRLNTWRTHMAPLTPLLRVSFDESAHTWCAVARLQASDGSSQEIREAEGRLEMVQVLRKDKNDEEKLVDAPITGVDLLGVALSAALDLARDWEGPLILEADARQNGMLKVGLHDWVRAGRLEEGEAAFVYAREAWVRVLTALRSEPVRLTVRWTPGG